MGFCAFLLASSHSIAAEIAPTKFVTANGITVLVLEQHFLPIVEIHTLIKAGSAQDPPEKAGLANLVASLLDEGTTTRTSKQQAEQIDFVGGALEARASEDFTTASARVLKKDIDLGSFFCRPASTSSGSAPSPRSPARGHAATPRVF